MAHILDALSMAFVMLWEIFWALALGFFISAVIQALVSRKKIVSLLPDAGPRSLAIACGLGAASSSCSYAAVAIARSLVRKGANFTSSIAFEFASTNLVLEISILLFVLLGWQFMAAEFFGGIVAVIVLAFLFRMFLRKRMVDEARAQAERGLLGAMEGHAAMDMSLKETGSFIQRLTSPKGFTAVSHLFIMDILMVWKDIAIGLVLAGCLAAWVPASTWSALFYSGHGTTSSILGAFIGPIVSILSFVCSVGNIPLAAVLWSHGIGFAGTISFILADLLIIPILNIYRKYYGVRMMIFLAITSYAAIVVAGLVIEAIFSAAGAIPSLHPITISPSMIEWNYTAYLNILFLGFVSLFFVRFLRTNGLAHLKMMDSPDGHGHHHHEGHSDHEHHHHKSHAEHELHTSHATHQNHSMGHAEHHSGHHGHDNHAAHNSGHSH